MSTTRNHPLNSKTVARRANVDVASGPRTASDPRGVRATQQLLASQMAGLGLRYDDKGRLEVDPENVELLALATNNSEVSLDQALEALAKRAYYGRLLFSNTTTVQTNTTVSAFDYATFEIPSNLLVGIHQARMVSHGYIYNATGGGVTFTLKVILGGTTHYNDVSISIPSSGPFRGFLIDVTYQATSSSAGQKMHGTVIVGDSSGPTTGYGSLNADALMVAHIGNNGGTVDMTKPQSLTFEITPSTSSGNYEFGHYGSYLIGY